MPACSAQSKFSGKANTSIHGLGEDGTASLNTRLWEKNMYDGLEGILIFFANLFDVV